MGLEHIVDVKDGKPKSVKFSADKAYNAYTQIGKLQEIDLEAPEGLEEFAKLTGYDLSQKRPYEVAREAQAIVSGYANDFKFFSQNNYDGFLGELSEEQKMAFAMQHSPSQDYASSDKKSEEDEKFSKTRSDAKQFGDLIRKIQENPGAVLKERQAELSKKGDIGRYILADMAADPQGYISMIQQSAQDRGFHVIAQYGGADKYLKEVRKRVTAGTQEARDKRATLIAERNEAMKSALEGLEYAPAGEIAKAKREVATEYADKIKEATGNNPDLDLIERMNVSVYQPAMEAILKKKTKEAAEKKAKEDAEKKK